MCAVILMVVVAVARMADAITGREKIKDDEMLFLTNFLKNDNEKLSPYTRPVLSKDFVRFWSHKNLG